MNSWIMNLSVFIIVAISFHTILMTTLLNKPYTSPNVSILFFEIFLPIIGILIATHMYKNGASWIKIAIYLLFGAVIPLTSIVIILIS